MFSYRFVRFFRYLNFTTFRKTVVRAFQRRLMGLSSEMAFNALLSLFPAILAVFTAVGLFEDTLAAPVQSWANQIKEVAPEEVWILLQGFVMSLRQSRNSGLFSISFVAAIWIASSALSAAMNAFDQIHQIPQEKRRPIWKAKLISLVLTAGTIVLLLLASFLVFVSDLLINLAVDQTGVSFVETAFLFLLSFWRLLSWPIALAIISFAFAIIYRVGPSHWDNSRPILPGAVLAAFSWVVLSGLFRAYVANFGNYNRVYGTLGAFIILMLWLYMTALIMLLGDQLNTTVGEAMSEKDKLYYKKYEQD